MELRQYWKIIRRRWWWPVALTLAALAASGFFALRGASAYKTEMRLAVSTVPTVDPTSERYFDSIYYSNLNSEYLADDLTEFLTSRAFASEVSQELNQAIPDQGVLDATRAKKTHRFIDITINSPTPEQGQQIANSIARIVNDPNHIGIYLKALDAYKTSISVVTPPETRRSNTAAGIASEIGLRTIVGLIAGLAIAFLLDYLDNSVRDADDANELLNLPVLGEIPRLGRQAAA